MTTTRTNEPAYKRIAENIKNEIDQGLLKPNDAIPSINELVARENSTRSTVNRALTKLENEGYIASLPGKGRYVAESDSRLQPESSIWKIFLSYAHDDDRRTSGAITKFREKLQMEYELQTGDISNIFQDTQDIKTGANWRHEIESSLGVTTFFMPILTPTYLRSPQCLAELRTIATRFEDLERKEGIYPVEFVDCTKAIERLNDDHLATLLDNTQRNRSWIALRSEDPDSSAYKKGIRKIVEDLLEKETLLEEAQERQMENLSSDNVEYEGDILSRLANVNEHFVSLTEVTERIGGDVTSIGDVFRNTTTPEQMNPKQALSCTVQIAHALKTPCENLEQHCREYDEAMRNIDNGIDAYLEFLNLAKEMGLSDTEAEEQVIEMYESTCNLLDVIEDPFGQIDSMRLQLQRFSKLARVLRKPCDRIDSALDKITSSKMIFENWEQKLAALI